MQQMPPRACMRVNKIQLGLPEFMVLRRETAGGRPCFDMMEFANNIDLPDDLFENKAFQTMYDSAIDMIGLQNVGSPLCGPPAKCN